MIIAKILTITLLAAGVLQAQPVAVRYTEGLVHGFLALRTLGGSLVASGELLQKARGREVTSRLVFYYKDGSLHDDTAVFSQNGTFRLISDHLIQKGPSFKHPIDLKIDAASGEVTVRYQDDHGKEKVTTDHMELGPDLANGMVPILLKNTAPETQKLTLSMVVATPKPMVVKLNITNDGEDRFTAGGAGHKARRYDVKVDIGGLKGVVAEVIGKQPPDTFVWILGGEVPTFVRSEGLQSASSPVLRLELTSPTFPRNPPPAKK